jgi:heat shock protein HtpX
VFSAVVGFTGSIISLLISKPMAKWSTGAQVISAPSNSTELWLLDTVQKLADRAGIRMPEVAVYEGEPNAFATGAFKDSALVAVSTGLLQGMTRDEVEAVLGHEIAHVANGDMVTLTLITGVVNTFVVFLARIIGSLVDSALRGQNDRGGPGIGYFATVMVSQLVLGLFASMIVAWFSRQREFRADSGGAYLAGTRSMIGALEALKRAHSPKPLPQQFAAFGINGGIPQGLQKLFMSHPPLDERIGALEKAAGASQLN